MTAPRALAAVCTVATLLGSSTARSATLRGTLHNRTTGQPGKATSVRLIDVAKGMDQIDTKLNVDGSFVFENVPKVDQPPYLIQVQADGVLYSERIPVTTDQEVTVNIDVYDATDSLDDVTVEIFHVVFQRGSDHVEVAQLLQLQNNTSPPKAVWRDPGPILVEIPAEVHGTPEATIGSGPMPLRQELVETEQANIFAVPSALKPGQTRMFVRYLMSYADNKLDWSSTLNLDLSEVQVMVSPQDVAVSGPGIAPLEGNVPMQGYALYQAPPAKAGERIVVSLSGGSEGATEAADAHAGGSIQTRPNRLSRGAGPAIILSSLIALLLVGLAYGLSRAPVGDVDPRVQTREAALDALGRLEDRYVAGELDRATFEHQREQLRQRLLQPRAEGGRHGHGSHRRPKAAPKV